MRGGPAGVGCFGFVPGLRGKSTREVMFFRAGTAGPSAAGPSPAAAATPNDPVVSAAAAVAAAAATAAVLGLLGSNVFDVNRVFSGAAASV
jgi:hypothetical protein